MALGVGDIIKTRKNNRQLGVLNGQHFVIRSVSSDGGVRVQSVEADRMILELPAEYVGEWVQLGYATTVHSSQGMTVDEGHLLVTGQTDGAGVYVGLSRGKTSNVAHFVAGSLDEAREQFVAAVGRARADMGLEAHRVELVAMLEGTEYEQRQSEDYPVTARVAELEPGDRLAYQGKQYLVTRREEADVYALEPESKQVKIFTAKNQKMRVSLLPSQPLPAPKVIRQAPEQALAKRQRAKELESFLLASDLWQKNLEANPDLLGELVGAYHRQEQLTGVLAETQEALGTVQSDYEQALEAHEVKVRAAEAQKAQVQQKYDQMGRVEKFFTSNGPLREAERNLEQTKQQRPSVVQVREAEQKLNEVNTALEQVGKQLEGLSEKAGRPPVVVGVAGAFVGAGGLVGVDKSAVEREIRQLIREAESLVEVSESQEYLGLIWAEKAKDQERKESSQKPVASGPVARRRRPAPVQPQNLPGHQPLGLGQDMGLGL